MQNQISIHSWPAENITYYVSTRRYWWPRCIRRGFLGHSLSGIAGSNASAGMDVCFLCVLCDAK
jgi:hypothetical protein